MTKANPIRIHPQNNRIFEYRGKPLVLVCATEHYGAVINRPFKFEKYLADAAEKKQTLTRLFVLFREQQSSMNPYSTCKPESPDFISPFKRTGPGMALDGQLKYDLTQWNPEFFERLHRFLSLAADYGIIVEVTLLSNTYGQAVWDLNPLNSENNINNLEKINWTDYNTLRNPKILQWQIAHVRKIVEETKLYDNIIYEICNEPGGKFPGDDTYPTPSEVDDWQIAIAQVIRENDAAFPHQHLIAAQEAFTYDPWEQSSNKSFHDFPIDIVNMHPLPNTTYGGKGYHMGDFMSKQLKIRELRDYCLATINETKPLNLDEDNVASQYKDPDGWIIHRKRAWTTLFCGCHYDVIDFSIINYLETGTPDSQRHIRTWMKHLSEFIHSVDLTHARPLVGWLKDQSAHTVESVFAVEGEDYCIYLADERELEHEGYGSVIRGMVNINLPLGWYSVSCYSPATGLYSPSITMEGSPDIQVNLPEFSHDLVVRITRLEDNSK
ncbi:MAG TPA: DUF6298 domain-containing protein [Bacilli bacterium]